MIKNLKNTLENSMPLIFMLILPLFTTWACEYIMPCVKPFEVFMTSMVLYACMLIAYIMIKE